MSLITEQELIYIETFERSAALRKQGALLYGPNLSLWPIWAVDVFSALEVEVSRIERLTV